MIQSDWYVLYADGWKNEIVPDAFAHPAKFRRALIRRIYQHVLEEGWIAAGDIVLDPFAGTGLGAADALALGLNFVGCELEQNFVDMGAGCECTGISKADWIRFYGRWKRAAYLQDRHWCPECLGDAGRIVDQDNQLSMFGRPSANYRRNSGVIPHTEPHHYIGNLELFRRYAIKGNTATLLQGDSRALASVLAGRPEVAGDIGAGLGVSSPPFGQAQTGGTGFWEGLEDIHGRKFSDKVRNGAHGYRQDEISPANLGNMREGSHALAVSSPPYADAQAHPSIGSVNKDEWGTDGRDITARRGLSAAYGSTPGQLGAMAVSSPPYAGSVNQSDQANDSLARLERKAQAGIDITHKPNVGGPNSVLNKPQVYGTSPGQLGAMAVSSPPWEESLDRGVVNKNERTKLARELGISNAEHISPIDMERIGKREQEYGDTAGQMGNDTGTDFWQAARAVVEQLRLCLRPGAHAVWVLKGFVRDKAYVDFPMQWAEMCQACGFEPVHWHRAWLVEEHTGQLTLDGGMHTRRVERKSFFRRLAESKGSPRVDYEVVLCTRLVA